LSKNTSKLQTAMERLSTGVRINSAKDDAAGLAITTRMTSEIRGLQVAVRNANDGISVAQTAEGSLGEITNILQRLRELAVQSANASNNETDRSFLDTEAQQLIAETNRIGDQANFNGVKLLDGSFQARNFQVGAKGNETITFNSISDSRATGLGQHTLVSAGSILKGASFAAGTSNGITAVTSGFTLSTDTTKGGGTSASITYGAGASAKAIAEAINNSAAAVGVTATASNSATLSNLSAPGTITFTLNSSSISAVVTATNDLTAIAAAINGAPATNVKATFAGTDKSTLTLTSNAGEDIAISGFANTTVASDQSALLTAGTNSFTLTETSAAAQVVVGTISLTSSKGAITAAGASTQVFNSASASSAFTSVGGVSLSTAASSNAALAILDQALTQVNNTRAALGGLMNRFSATIANQNTTIANLSASRSRILDADYAVETTNLAKSQIIQQAATAMLAQANQSSQSVLALLK